MDIVIAFIITIALLYCGYYYYRLTQAQKSLYWEIQALEMKINRELENSMQEFIRAQFTANTVDVRTINVPRMEANIEQLLKRIAVLEGEISAVHGAMEYMKLLKFQMTSLEKLVKDEVAYLDQTTGGMAKASTEVVEMYRPIVNQMNMLSARMDGMVKIMETIKWHSKKSQRQMKI